MSAIGWIGISALGLLALGLLAMLKVVLFPKSCINERLEPDEELERQYREAFPEDAE